MSKATTNCGEGYSGKGCQACAPGFYADRAINACSKCPDEVEQTDTTTYTVMAIIFASTFLFGLATVSLARCRREGRILPSGAGIDKALDFGIFSLAYLQLFAASCNPASSFMHQLFQGLIKSFLVYITFDVRSAALQSPCVNEAGKDDENHLADVIGMSILLLSTMIAGVMASPTGSRKCSSGNLCAKMRYGLTLCLFAVYNNGGNTALKYLSCTNDGFLRDVTFPPDTPCFADKVLLPSIISGCLVILFLTFYPMQRRYARA